MNFEGHCFGRGMHKFDKSELLRQIDCFRETGYGRIGICDLGTNAVGL